jgi:hypothetical protein
MLDPCILNTVLDSLSFGILEFHLRMRHICRPKLYNSGRPPVAQDIVEDIRERIEDNPNISLRRLALQSKSTDLLLCSRLLF